MWFFGTTSAITNYQSGSRKKKRSTTDCPAQNENVAETAMSWKEYTITVIFKLTKAYDLTRKQEFKKNVPFTTKRLPTRLLL